MRLFIIRHADPSLESDAITSKGHQQAKILAPLLAEMKIDRIFSSPLNRSLETMNYTSELTGIKPQIEEWLKELDWTIAYKHWEERSAWNLPGEVIRSFEESEKKSVFENFMTSKMVSDLEFMKKSSDLFMKNLGYERCNKRYKIISPNNNKIAIFTHNGFGLTWLSFLLDIPLFSFWASFWLDPCSLTTVHFESRSENWATPRVLCLSDISHLQKEKLNFLPSSIYSKFN